MKLDLKNSWDIEAVVLYDRPAKKVAQPVDKNSFLKKYNEK